LPDLLAIRDLNGRIKGFFQSNPYEVVSNLSNDGTKEIWRFKLTKKIPTEIPIIIGEILHNLRSPLDQILCAITIKHGISEDGIAFSRGRTEDELKAALERQRKRGLPADAVALVLAAMPHASDAWIDSWNSIAAISIALG
jgi:hypothetical protein